MNGVSKQEYDKFKRHVLEFIGRHSQSLSSVIHDGTLGGLGNNSSPLTVLSSGAIGDNTIFINQAGPVIVGKQYQSFASAFIYLHSLPVGTHPSITSPWTIIFNGIITENIIIPEYVSIMGEEMNATINGTVNFESIGVTDGSSNKIGNCTIKELAITGTKFVSITKCNILNCIPDPTGNPSGIYINFSNITGGDFTSFSLLFIVNSTYFLSGSFNIVIPYSIQHVVIGCLFASFGVKTVKLNGGYYSNCSFINTQNYLFDITNTLFIYNSWIKGTSLTTPINSALKIYDSTIDINTITYNGNFNTYNCYLSSIPILGNPAGFWKNIGSSFDNALTGLTSTEMVGAIKELKVLLDDLSNQIFQDDFLGVLREEWMVGSGSVTFPSEVNGVVRLTTGALVTDYALLNFNGYDFISTAKLISFETSLYINDHDITSVIIGLSNALGTNGLFFHFTLGGNWFFDVMDGAGHHNYDLGIPASAPPVILKVKMSGTNVLAYIDGVLKETVDLSGFTPLALLEPFFRIGNGTSASNHMGIDYVKIHSL